MYSIGQFAEYLARGAAGIVQVDVARIGGITPWLKVAHLAEAHNVKVCPHFLMELHVSLAARCPTARTSSTSRSCARSPTARSRSPTATRSRRPRPGLGIDWDRDAIDDRRVA